MKKTIFAITLITGLASCAQLKSIVKSADCSVKFTNTSAGVSVALGCDSLGKVLADLISLPKSSSQRSASVTAKPTDVKVKKLKNGDTKIVMVVKK